VQDVLDEHTTACGRDERRTRARRLTDVGGNAEK
jgi:hypothetical protein